MTEIARHPYIVSAKRVVDDPEALFFRPLAVFAAGVVSGAICGTSLFRDLASGVAGSANPLDYLHHNLQALVIVCLLASACPFLGYIVLATQGYILGEVISLMPAGIEWAGVVAAAILPHGVFELPAMFLAVGIGERNGRKIRAPGGEGKRPVSKTWVLATTADAFLFVILPLLVFAAAAEAIVTPRVVGAALSIAGY